MRLSDARRDHYRKLAKDKGYRSRSAYKLLQLNNSYHIFRQGDKVIDLGSAPGGWLQIAKEKVGTCGRVIGIDIKELEPIDDIIIFRRDIEDQTIVDEIIGILNCKADIVLSDLSPNVSGIWDIDHARQISLTRNAWTLVQKVLKKGGTAIFKVFEGELLNRLKRELSTDFDKVLLTKPDASRQKSSELYIICLSFRDKY
ncbi:MAG TPA: RlmE family RNA methyltransferase [Nitrososphaeraceae archaeon]|nr:RlmE family RNA methyltransferase [Nitrososphaeraceae archaeon]